MPNDDTNGQRSMIGAADPLAQVPPLRSDQAVALARRAMDDGDDMRASARRTRRPLVVGIALAAVTVVAGAAVAVSLSSTPSPQPMLLRQVPGGTSAKCAAPEPASLAEYADSLFRAEVTGISGGLVTLAVTDTLAGDPGDIVEVAQGDGQISDGGPLVFETQGSYLIATQDGVILSCGLSGPASPELEQLYAEAARLQEP